MSKVKVVTLRNMSRKGEPNNASGRLHLSENICGTKCKMRLLNGTCNRLHISQGWSLFINKK